MTGPRSQYDLDAEAMSEGFEDDQDRRSALRQRREAEQEYDIEDDLNQPEHEQP